MDISQIKIGQPVLIKENETFAAQRNRKPEYRLFFPMKKGENDYSGRSIKCNETFTHTQQGNTLVFVEDEKGNSRSFDIVT